MIDAELFFMKRVELYGELDSVFMHSVIRSSKLVRCTIAEGGKILIFGNGGSAAQAQHFAAELICTYQGGRERPLPAIALTTDTSVLTARSNDVGFEDVFSRQIEGLGRQGDLVMGLTTSDVVHGQNGHSRNIFLAFQKAKGMGLESIGLFSRRTSELLGMVSESVVVPSDGVSLIQEVHDSVLHFFAESLEDIEVCS